MLRLKTWQGLFIGHVSILNAVTRCKQHALLSVRPQVPLPADKYGHFQLSAFCPQCPPLRTDGHLTGVRFLSASVGSPGRTDTLASVVNTKFILNNYCKITISENEQVKLSITIVYFIILITCLKINNNIILKSL